jgi:hypothetical protein
MKTMNKIRLLAMLPLFALLLNGCKENIEGELGESYDKVAGMNGTWELTKFSQIDLNNPIKEERDLTEFYIIDGITPMQIIFDSNEKSYEVLISAGRNYFGPSGTWTFDDNEYPSFLLMDDGTTERSFELGRVVREFDNSLVIDLRRGCSDADGNFVETVVYHFEFTRK